MKHAIFGTTHKTLLTLRMVNSWCKRWSWQAKWKWWWITVFSPQWFFLNILHHFLYCIICLTCI